jgi:hypothetical protein
MLDLLLQFTVELIRALLVDELSGHVRKSVRFWRAGRQSYGSNGLRWRVNQRNRERLLNKLLTEIEDEL